MKKVGRKVVSKLQQQQNVVRYFNLKIKIFFNLKICKIPKLEVNGSEVYKFYKKYPPLDCTKKGPKPWVYIDEERKVQPTEFAKRFFY